MTSFLSSTRLVQTTPTRSLSVPPVGHAGPGSRMTRAEELELGTTLCEHRCELLAIALLDPASRAELERISGEVARGAQRIEAVVDARASDADAARRDLGALLEELARWPTPAAGLDAAGCAEGRAPGASMDAAVSGAVERALRRSRALAVSVPLQWDAVERLLDRTWVKHGPAPGADLMPAGLRRRVQRMLGEVERIVARFVSANQGLVLYVVQRYRNLGLGQDDLIQEGNLGLLKAVERFDVRRGNPFSSYAIWWIREAVRRALAQQGRTIRVPVHTLARRYKLGQASRRLSHELGREPSDEELAGATGLAPAEVAEVSRLTREPVSLDAPRGEDSTATIGDAIPDDNLDPNERVSAQESVARVRVLLDSLSPREQCVLRLRFGLDGADEQTLEEIGRALDLTRERVRQIVVEALGKLNRQSRLRQLEL